MVFAECEVPPPCPVLFSLLDQKQNLDASAHVDTFSIEPSSPAGIKELLVSGVWAQSPGLAEGPRPHISRPGCHGFVKTLVSPVSLMKPERFNYIDHWS